MINLLPYEKKKQLSAARMNTVLLRYNIIFVSAVIFIAAAMGVVYIFLSNMLAAANQTIDQNIRREQSSAEKKNDVSSFQSTLQEAKSIFASEYSYSTALIRYANIFPKGTAISEMKLSKDSFGKPIEVNVKIASRSAASALEKSLSTTKYVQSYEKKSVAKSDDKKYPYSWTIALTLSEEIAKP